MTSRTKFFLHVIILLFTTPFFARPTKAQPSTKVQPSVKEARLAAQPSMEASLYYKLFRKTPIRIKVLLEEYPINKQKKFAVSCKKTLFFKKRLSSQAKKFRAQNGKMDLLLKRNTLYARTGKKPFRKVPNNEIHFLGTALKEGRPLCKGITKPRPLTLNNQAYKGILSFKLCPREKKLLLINTLNLEDYIYAVLRAESYQTWPNEMQKVQAVVSRTYAVHQILEKRKSKTKKSLPYDIRCTNFHQRYTGNHKYKHLLQAVIDTQGLILTHQQDKKKPSSVVLTMFDACCGGSVPARMTGLNFEKAPYLCRKRACHHCKSYGLYSWKRKIPTTTFVRALRNYKLLKGRVPRGQLLTIKTTDRDKAGIVHKVTLGFSRGKAMELTGKDIWMALPKQVRSQNFSIRKFGKHVIITGRGFGHQIGLCQRGARELVRKGWPMKKVLSFYYPNTSLARLKVTKPTGEQNV